LRRIYKRFSLLQLRYVKNYAARYGNNFSAILGVIKIIIMGSALVIFSVLAKINISDKRNRNIVIL
jgi:hypothetical protein